VGYPRWRSTRRYHHPTQTEDCEESGCGVPAETDRDSRRSRDAPAREYSKHRAGGEHTDVGRRPASVTNAERARTTTAGARRRRRTGQRRSRTEHQEALRCRQVHGSPRPSCHIEYEGTSLEKTVPHSLSLPDTGTRTDSVRCRGVYCRLIVNHSHGIDSGPASPPLCQRYLNEHLRPCGGLRPVRGRNDPGVISPPAVDTAGVIASNSQ